MKELLYCLIAASMAINATVAPPLWLKGDPRLSYVQRQLVKKGFDPTKVEKLLSDERRELYSVKIVRYKKPDWELTERRMFGPSFVSRGLNYLKQHEAIFRKTEVEFGVPSEVIVGVIAIESEFGRNPGGTPTFNALYSRLEHWPEDKWLGQADQLVALSTYCLKSGHDCFVITGSYVGAIGIVQFMPDSLLAYGVDGNHDGIVDLMNPADAIPSAANYLVAHEWYEDEMGALTHYYGDPEGYPEIVLMYASILKEAFKQR